MLLRRADALWIFKERLSATGIYLLKYIFAMCITICNSNERCHFFLCQTENAPSTLCGKLERKCLFFSKLLNSYTSSQRIVYGGFSSCSCSSSFLFLSYTLLPNKSLTWSELLQEQFDIKKKKCRSSSRTLCNTCWGYPTIMQRQRVTYARNCLSRTQSGSCAQTLSPPW